MNSIFSIISRMLSTPVFEAASISMMSTRLPSAMSVQVLQVPHGLPSFIFSQLSAFAKILAEEVLPVPRLPAKRYAWAGRSDFIAFWRVFTTDVWPARSVNVFGRYFRKSVDIFCWFLELLI